MLIYLQTIKTEEDKVKFASIYDRYRDYMLTVAHRISDNEEDAEDAVHQPFLYVIENFMYHTGLEISLGFEPTQAGLDHNVDVVINAVGFKG